MSFRRRKDNDDTAEPLESSELEALIQEKTALATKLGLMGGDLPDPEKYKQTKEYKRIQEIDKRLWELV